MRGEQQRRVGRYKLLEQIGEGGFGVVYMAEQEKSVRRTVALKIIKLGTDTRQVVARPPHPVSRPTRLERLVAFVDQVRADGPEPQRKTLLAGLGVFFDARTLWSPKRPAVRDREHRARRTVLGLSVTLGDFLPCLSGEKEQTSCRCAVDR